MKVHSKQHATTVADLLGGRSLSSTVDRAANLASALDVMSAEGSQHLAVLDSDGKALGVVSESGILRALRHFFVPLEQVRVDDAMNTHVRRVQVVARIWEVISWLRDDAVVLVERDGCLVGLLTDVDLAAYLQRRSEDLVLVQDIEETLKQLVRLGYEQTGGDLPADVQAVMNGALNRHGKAFAQAVEEFASLSGVDHNKRHANLAFRKFVEIQQRAPDFEQLSFSQYIDLFGRPACWNFYDDLVGDLPKKNLIAMLQRARETRNDLAHLRGGGLSPSQRDQLRFCKTWLDQRLAPELEFADDDAMDIESAPAVLGSPSPDLDGLDPEDEDLEAQPMDPSDRGGQALRMWFRSKRSSEVMLSFEDIERVLDNELPPEARVHRSWWSNVGSHEMADSWLEEGWAVARVSLTGERVKFRKNRERAGAYLAFFQQLVLALRERTDWPFDEVSPQPISWLRLAGLPENGRSIATFNAAFTRSGRFRLGLYIDSGDAHVNQQLFENLRAHQSEIAAILGQDLEWDVKDGRRACRVAVYYPEDASVEEEAGALDRILEWAASTAGRLHEAVAQRFKRAQAEVTEPDQSSN